MADSFENRIRRLQNGNDVRGAAIAAGGEERTLTPGIAKFIARAFVDFLSESTGKPKEELRIGVGHDSRVTADILKEAILSGVSDAISFDCGLITTPAMFQSTVLPDSDFDGSVMITASHLPFNRNGMKFFTKNGGLEHDELTAVLTLAVSYAEEYGREDAEELISADDLPVAGRFPREFDMVGVYCEAMKTIIRKNTEGSAVEKPLSGLHIIVDAGNGASGFFATRILEELGADISGSVYLDPDGSFPNHIPNPENKDAMNAARKATVDAGADLGVIFDCDGDRGAVVFSDGTEVNRNALIALLASIVADQHPDSTVVTDSVTSDELQSFLEDHLGMKHLRFKRGYKNVINKGIELNKAGEDCELAIETSGHGAFRENYFSDDGAYIAVRIICTMAQLKKEGRTIDSLIADLKSPAESIELRYMIKDPDFAAYGTKVLDAFRHFIETDTRFHVVSPNYEGIRIAFDDAEVKGWMLVRKSLHDPVLPMNIESEKQGGAEIILGRVRPFFEGFDRLSLS